MIICSNKAFREGVCRRPSIYAFPIYRKTPLMILLEIIAYFFVDLLFEGVIMGGVRLFRKLGKLFGGKSRTEKQPKRK